MTGPERPVRVLVVDDDEAVAAVHRGYVQRIPGFAVVGVVHRGSEVLPAVTRTRPDLVLLDVHLPDRSGIDVLRELRARRVPVDVITITAAREIETVREAMAGGVSSYLVKPFPLQVFADRLRDYAEHRDRFRRLREEAEGPLGQDEVDRLLGLAPRPVALRPLTLPKALSDRTMDLVVETLRGSTADDLSAVEVAELCGLSRVSARRYLDHLERTGFADVRPRYGRAGRPENGYRWRSAQAPAG
ncbi:response regulator [Modestobacter sp. Leaf380]|uniref:response regulator n=1 Tax=Modestobacter sp. Leaf380 TaxID=1736356 RepID=UPI0006F976E4|nr:response regulator [Modestobacter sp. Leaf380]KQS72132.1 two-component system response regulator [Modestobacter sp. Leaf380]